MNDPEWVPDSCEVILLDCSVRAGAGYVNSSPFLVLSSRAFNARTSCVVGLQAVNDNYSFLSPNRGLLFQNACADDAVEFNLNHYSLFTRPKSFNWRYRYAEPYPMHNVPESFFVHACNILKKIVAVELPGNFRMLNS